MHRWLWIVARYTHKCFMKVGSAAD